MSIPSGFLLINKPPGLPRGASAKWGPTSHDIIDELRRITGERRIGHAGTLDPFASGLLIVAVGREATRQISQFSKMDKTYVAKLHLGATSDTFDRTGLVQNGQRSLTILHRTEIEKVLQKFVGEQMQIPPMYSAKKVGGKKLYELARKGIEIEREPVKINIHYIKLLNSHLPIIFPFGKIIGKDCFDKIDDKNGDKNKENCSDTHLVIETRVSSGTYIRTLAHDIGQALGCGAYLEELCRTAIGDYKLEDAVETKNLTKENWTNYLADVNIKTGTGGYDENLGNQRQP